MPKVTFSQKEESTIQRKIGPGANKKLFFEMLRVVCCIICIGNVYYEEDAKEVPKGFEMWC